jgi:hypothetical protein
MSDKLKTIVPLKTGTTAIMLSKYSGLVRTGVPNNKYSFIHALLTSYSKKYRDMNQANKESYVSLLCEKIKTDMTLTKWLELTNSTKTIDRVHQRIRKMFIKIYGFLSNKIHESKVDSQIMKIITSDITPRKDYFNSIISIIPLKILDKKYLHNIFKQIESSTQIHEYKTTIKEHLVSGFTLEMEKVPDIKKLNKTIYKNMQKYFTTMVSSVVESAENSTFENFKNELVDPETTFDESLFDFFGEYFGRNILFLNSVTRAPYHISMPSKPYSKTLLLLSIDGAFADNLKSTFYESIGYIDHKHKIIREFKHTSDTVQSILDDLKYGESAADVFETTVSKQLSVVPSTNNNKLTNSKPATDRPDTPTVDDPDTPTVDDPDRPDKSIVDDATSPLVSSPSSKQSPQRSRMRVKSNTMDEHDEVYHSADSDSDYTDDDNDDDNDDE